MIGPTTDGLFYVSRIQFGITALFHFLFVPLTLGLTWVLVTMEAVYLKTNKVVYKDLTRFFGKLLTINFAMGVVTGVTLEFEFGQNWAYFARYIGDAFGPILAVEGITAFMLEATMLGVFLFGWDKLSKGAHFIVTLLLALGANLSIINILAANSWMQHPVGTYFNYHTMHMHLMSLAALYLNPVAQIRIGHVACAGLMTGSFFVLGICSYYLLKNRDVEFAKRGFAIAAGFAFVAVLAVGFFGDENGLEVARYEPVKMAAIEGQWVTQKAPASWFAIAFPDNKNEKNYLTLPIPYMLSIIATHSLSGTVEGLKPLMQKNREKIIAGAKAYDALKNIRLGNDSYRQEQIFKEYGKYLGYGFLLNRYAHDPAKATTKEINKAVKDSIPEVWMVFWSFRFMVGFWLLMLISVMYGFILACRNTIQNHRWLLRFFLYALPLPWLCCEFGWITAEVGRQPWVVHGIMPTFMGVSTLSTATVSFSLGGFILFYSTLFIVELCLMFKYARLGPSSLGEKRYHFEKKQTATA